MRPRIALLLLVAAPLLCSCGIAPGDSGYRTVKLSYDYGTADRHARQWDTLMAAQEKCHQGGFTNAEPATAAETTCIEGTADGCRRTHATQVYDCVGMGWQDN